MNSTPQFPKTIFAEQKTVVEQVEHMIEESDELAKALQKHRGAIASGDQSQINQTFAAMLDEATDLGHSYSTLCNNIPNAMNISAQQVISKNMNRGYYDIKGAVEKNLAQPDVAPKIDPAKPQEWYEFLVEKEHPGAPDEFTREDLTDLHKELTGKAFDLMQKKNADYTGDGGTFANFESSTSFNVHPVQGALIRMMDKLQRINSFIERGVLQVSDESVEDTIIDSINYPVLIAGMIRQEKLKQ